ncbi:hypothetical protein L1987_09832 [Smallanthus sonchifolius]|uniref:Uncharacterized protein n=1 Tax=Smallanthus sonchifolius TaxID=185202 RepID=A0ACB9JQF5_9ASTR|nr:hypothetical protein L1987_09832 [Smallanthus sonchifolius]
MPVSESEKLGVSVLERHFGEKAEHIPIKKRRFLFRASSPTHNIANTPLENAERHETSPKLNSNANSLSATSGALTETCESGSKDHKLDQNKLMKDDDFSGISILAAAACSNSLGAETDHCEGSGVLSSVNQSVPKNVELNENNVKKEPDSHTSTPLKIEESTLNSFSSHAHLESAFNKPNQEPNIQKSPARDVRFSWDLNTVMDAWEEPFANEHQISASNAANDNASSVEEKKNDYTKDNSGILPVELKNLSHENKELQAEKFEQLSHEFEIAQNAVAVKTESMQYQNTDSACDDIPVTRTLALENPTHGTFSKWTNLSGQSSGGFGSTQVVDTRLSMDCSIPPGFDHCFNLHACKENIGPAAKHELSLNTATCMENGPHQSGVTSNKVDNEDMTKMEVTNNVVTMEDRVNKEETGQSAAASSMHDAAYSDAFNGFGYGNSQRDNRAGSGIDKLDESLVGYDSQYEDGELRESTINAWKGYGLTEGQNEYDMNKIEDANETKSQNVQENSPAIKESTELESGKEADLTPSMVLPEKLLSSDEALSGSEPNEMIGGQEKSGRQDIVQPAASQSDEWKMNVSGSDLLPENQRINSNNFTKSRNFTARKFSYREEQKDRFDTEDVEMKAEGSRFYRKESLTRIGGSSTRDVFLGRGRFQMQRCSSKDGDGLSSRPERESGGLRFFGRGRYSPHNRPSGQGGGLWNRSPERSREGGLSYHRFILENSGNMDNMTNEGGMDLSDTGRNNTSYVTRRSFRSRSPASQEVNDYRARLGLRPTADTGRDRFVSLSRGRGRGRSIRYGTRLDDDGSRGRYHGPASDECDEFMTEYSHPFPRGRRCFSPIERRENNNSYQHHQSDSRSPSRPRTRSPIGNSGFRRRSRSPGFRPDGRIRRPRSPPYRDHPSEYNSGPRNHNSPPPSSRWVNYKDRPVFNRSPPPGRADGPHGERFNFYDSSRKPRQNEYYRSEHPGRFSDVSEGGRGRPRYVGNDGDRPNNGYRRGGFVRRYNMDGPAKRFQYDEEDGYGLGFDARDRQALEHHARSNSNPNTKPCNDGNDSRFRDFPRRQREDGGDLKRRSREGKDPKQESEHVTDDFERRPKEVKDQPTTTSSTTNLDSMVPNVVVKEGDNKPISGSN